MVGRAGPPCLSPSSLEWPSADLPVTVVEWRLPSSPSVLGSLSPLLARAGSCPLALDRGAPSGVCSLLSPWLPCLNVFLGAQSGEASLWLHGPVQETLHSGRPGGWQPPPRSTALGSAACGL